MALLWAAVAVFLAAAAQNGIVCAYLPEDQHVVSSDLMTPVPTLFPLRRLLKRSVGSAALPDRPPECFNCLMPNDQCINYGTCDQQTGYCVCSAGFGGFDCKTPLCGALSDPAENRPEKPADQPCQCKDGWTGINCNVCQRDDVCRSMVAEDGETDSGAVCYAGRKLVHNAFNTCGIKNERLLGLLGGKTVNITFECNKENEYCRMEFWVNYAQSFSCQFSECSDVQYSRPGVNATNLVCKTARCDCIHNAFLCGAPDSIDISDMFPEVKGPAMLSCRDPGFDGGRYNCEFDEPVFRENLGPILGNNPVIELDCLSGECVHQSRIPDSVEERNESSTVTTVVLISLGVVAAACSGLLLFWLVVKHRRNQLYLAAATNDVDGELEKLMESGHHIPATVLFRNISYDVGGDMGYRRVLRGIHGIVKPGEVMAIMGTSGAGKTTCLDILAGKSKRGIVTGDILINGARATRELYKRISGYVDQEDAMLDTLTVYETIRYSALLRLPRTMSLAAKEKRVQQAMSELGITHIANSRVGSGGHRGISGGEKRRVAIAMELVTSPSIIFLDEPTSGLDSYNALAVVQSLVTLAKQYNRTVIMTIHQPRSNIFALFDRLLLLAEGGYMVYSGPVVSSPQHSTLDSGASPEPVLLNCLRDLGVECPPGYNLADYLIDVTKLGSGGVGGGSADDDYALDLSVEDRKSLSLRQRQPSSRTSTPLDESRGGNDKAHLLAAWDVGSETGASSSSGGGGKEAALRGSHIGVGGDLGDVTTKLRGSASKSALQALIPAAIIQSYADKPQYIEMSAADAADITVQPPSLVHLVTGFLKSNACRTLQAEIDESLSTPMNAPPPLPRSPSSDTSGLLPDPASASINPPYPYATDGAKDSYRGGGDTATYPEANVSRLLFAETAPQLSASLKPSAWTQFMVLSSRSFVNFYRNPYLMLGHYTLSIAVGFICGLLFWQVTDNVSGFQNRLGVMFFQLTMLGLSSLSVLELFSKERQIFVRERAGGFYNVTIYFITKVLFDVIPLRVVPPVLLSCISYFMIGLVPDSSHFLKFVLAMVLFNLSTASICLVIAVATTDLGVANLIGVITMLFSMLFSGFLLNKVNLAVWIRWVLYISPFNYALEAVLGNEMKDISLIDRQLGIPIQVPGSLLMKAFGLDPLNYWPDVGYLSVLFACFLFVAYLVLQLFVRERR